MATMPNPFLNSAAVSPCPAEQAAASSPHASACDAAAAPIEYVDLNQICIGEIFAGARKLEQSPGIFDPAAITGADELLYVTLKAMDDPHERDLPEIPDALWAEFEPLPLFLRQAV